MIPRINPMYLKIFEVMALISVSFDFDFFHGNSIE